MYPAFLALGLLVLGLPMSTSVAESTGNEQVAQRLDRILRNSTDPRSPGMAVLVKVDGKLVLEKGYGVRRAGAPELIDAHTNFRLASLSKEFTAMAIMLLVHDAKLRYDTSLTQIFPEFPAYGRDITVRQLLTHTSGLPDYEDLMDLEEKTNGPRWSPGNQIQDAEVLALLEKQKQGKFPPGSRWAYSNSGYVVLGLIVAKASGVPFADFVRLRIFEPLGMKDSVVFQKGKNEIANRAYGSSPAAGKFGVTDQSSTSATLGDGGVYSNVSDMSRWDDGLRNHTLLSEAEFAPALIPVRLSDGAPARWPSEPGDDNLAPGEPVDYGFGWFLDPWEGRPRMWHFGSTMGFRNAIQRFSRDPVTIVVLSNRSDLHAEAISTSLAALLFAAN